ncbi:MAG: hypothetical protein UY40_C0007G0003 [candidate division CPR1 bacterium GW2011_GWC1_49_13]|uniref:DUF3105 domain-containing protein n=1 Tax=candidate division CPR1 bacterium GW2011_GWC1_49_13 TaxID=1618342 RepID=A0A0G1YHI7_9BACT|nr:MAG: hypothetical protein UY40_C0007G0003 [candidate division CPR1 bacterium GW2011_GWC1_49_13]
MNIKKIILIVALGAVGLGSLVWLYSWLSRPLPGVAVEDLGRNHVAVGTAVQYNSNPPTSGPHYAEWTRAGIYDEPIADGYLLHALEHGYVIFHYQDEALKDELVKLVEELNGQKLIVVARPDLDTPLVLTAWGRIMPLDGIDEAQIRDFVGVFRNAGPEQTLE